MLLRARCVKTSLPIFPNTSHAQLLILSPPMHADINSVVGTCYSPTLACFYESLKIQCCISNPPISMRNVLLLCAMGPLHLMRIFYSTTPEIVKILISSCMTTHSLKWLYFNICFEHQTWWMIICDGG